MTLSEIQKICRKLYYPVFLLEDFISRRVRNFFSSLGFVLFLLLLGISFALYLAEILKMGDFTAISYKFLGGAFLSLVLWAIFFSLQSFFYSFYFKLPEENQELFVDFDLAHSLYKLSLEDVSGSFFAGALGFKFLLRCSIEEKSLENFLKNRQTFLTAGEFKRLDKDNIFNFVDFISGLYDSDPEVKKFLSGHGIQKKDAVNIAAWIMEVHAAKHAREGWWREERLKGIPSIGEDWSYGRAYTLERYSRSLPQASFLPYGVRTSYGENEFNQIQSILTKSSEANVVLISDDTAGALHILSRLNQALDKNLTLPQLKDKKVMVLDTEALVVATGTKVKFESTLMKILNEAAYVGNIILVLDNLPAFVSSARSFDSDVSSILEPFLYSALPVIALSGVDLFHETLSKNVSIMKDFETVFVKSADDLSVIKILENESAIFEQAGFIFTYPSLLEIADSAERYFPNAIMPDKAIDLLTEVASKARILRKRIISKEDVLNMVEERTGIPVSGIKTDEKDKLLHMEEILHSRIVGQNEAISAISNAMRLARSGLENPKKPLGSFLFLGPTGVGKTETTKALASVFFGDEENIIRLDMSEYSSADSIAKLTGSFESNEPGVLSNRLSEKPYGVLLLDEFEKAGKEVRNLFLQILDEGFFSDMKGKKVIARNLIIIATSNAGSDIIWQMGREGKNLSKNKDEVNDFIVREKIFTPELLNRFDGVILFHPLSQSDLRKVTEFALNKLKNKLAEKGMELQINDTLINFVLKAGTDPKFGARPINRAINEDVEQIIAKKIIAGSLAPGSIIVLNEEDLINQ